jgi:hypothetical protein
MVKIVVLAVAVLLLGPGLAAAEVLELEGRYWFTDIKGSAKIEDDNIEGTRIDLEDDLGVDGEGMPELRFSFGLGGSRLRFAYTHVTFEGDKTLERNVTFSGDTFPAGTRVETEFDLHYGRAGWIWTPSIIPGVLRVGPMLELKGFLADVSLDSTAISESAKLPFVLPTLGAAGDFSFGDYIQVFAEVSGLPAGDYGYLVDAEAGVRVSPIPLVAVVAGYRIFSVRVGDDDDFGRMRLSGPFAGLAVRF